MNEVYPIIVNKSLHRDEIKKILESYAKNNSLEFIEDGDPIIDDKLPQGEVGRYIKHIENWKLQKENVVLYTLNQSGYDKHTNVDRGRDEYTSVIKRNSDLTTVIISTEYYTTPMPGEEHLDENRSFPSGSSITLYTEDDLGKYILEFAKQMQSKRFGSNLESKTESFI